MDDQNQSQADPVQNPLGSNQAEISPAVKREQEVGSTSTAFQELSNSEDKTPEFIQPSGEHVEPEIIPEVVEAGVEKTTSPSISPQARQVGVMPAGESVRHEDLSGSVQLSSQQAEMMVKSGSPNSSNRWLGILSLKVIKFFTAKKKNI